MRRWAHRVPLFEPKTHFVPAPAAMAGLPSVPSHLTLDLVRDKLKGFREQPLMSPSAQKAAMQDSSWADVRVTPS